VEVIKFLIWETFLDILIQEKINKKGKYLVIFAVIEMLQDRYKVKFFFLKDYMLVIVKIFILSVMMVIILFIEFNKLVESLILELFNIHFYMDIFGKSYFSTLLLQNYIFYKF